MPAPLAETDLLTPADAARILGLSVDMVRILATNGQLATAARTARGARLFRRCTVEELAASRAGRVVRHHAVQFYEADEHLAGAVAGFLADGLRGGSGAIVIATDPHRRDFVSRLSGAGFNTDGAIQSGQLLLLDARETLSTFFVGGRLDEALFRAHVGEAVARMRRQWPRARLRAYGEMVDLLWREGQRDAALALEELWNHLGETQSFSLLCAYSLDGFPQARDADAFDEICSTHTRVVPTESFHHDGDIDHKQKEIARLQQRAHALERELAERLRSEQALSEAKQQLHRYGDQLAEVLQAKDEILAMVGHDLRNSLAPLLMAIEVLDSKGVRSHEHAIIELQARHLHRVVDDLLDVGRLVRGKLQLHPTAVPVSQIVNRAVAMTGDVLETRRPDLELRPAPAALTIEVDLDRVAQALSSLLRNAIENSTPGSKIIFSITQTDEEIIFAVRDHGSGIPADLLPRVFDLVIQQSQGPDRTRRGLGIGLAIAKNLIQLHGGWVTAKSEGLGHGSEFTAALPLRQRVGPATGDVSHEAASVQGTKKRVLIVDDNEDAAAMLSEYLRDCGHETELAHQAEVALDADRRFRAEIAPLALGLHEIDGCALAHRPRAQNAGVRLVAVTGCGDCANRQGSAEAGFDAHLAKPVRVTELLKLVEEAR
jgi:signal transduction histidine kinase